MKKIYLLCLSALSIFTINAQDCSELFISEYIEGWNMNKAIEIFNPTDQSIDLSNYALSRWSNGGLTPQRTTLEGTISPYQAFVVAIDKRDPEGEGFEAPLWDGWYHYTDSITLLPDSVYDESTDLMNKVDLFICPNYEDGTMYFNGNDAITLETASGDILDIFGKIGEDPGQSWTDESGAYWTKDQTLVRKSTVTNPFVYDPNIEYSFDPTLEWDSLPANTFSGLGSHECNCTPADFSIEEKELMAQLFPNPTTNGVVSINANSTIETIALYNILGELVFAKSCSNTTQTETLSLNPTLKGLFFVEITLQDKEVLLKKLLLN